MSNAPSSLSVFESGNSTGQRTAETDTNEVSDTALDFVGSSAAVKDLFSLPYAVDRPISVAVHNLRGTLLVDAELSEDDVVRADNGVFADEVSSEKTSSLPESERKMDVDEKNGGQNLSRSLVALTSLERTSDALTIVNSMIESSRSSSNVVAESSRTRSQESLEEAEEISTKLGVPTSEDCTGRFIPPVPEPREYLSWKFHDMNLLVGSNAIIYRSPDASTALTLRLEEAENLKTLAQQHRDMVDSGKFVADHQFPKSQQMGKPSYAAATKRAVHQLEEEKDCTSEVDSNIGTDSAGSSFVAPDLEQVHLQTCIVPSPNVPVGALLNGQGERGVVRLEPGIEDSVLRSPSPVSAVMDTYLDNIMANVPQLALCLQEKGFVQSVKLLSTDQIPSALLHPSTTDTSIPFGVVEGTNQEERVFSPEIMEMNASTLLRFLKTQCTKDNATYLLRREAGQTNIQLYDISSISSKQQQKWNWWLAKMSYRFASRLRSLASNTPEKGLRRVFRARQRSLLQNTLDLLVDLSDMNGNMHESLIAAINEDLANTFLANEDDVKKEGGAPQGGTPTPMASQQPYSNATVDALGKAQDYLVEGIRVLWPTLARSRRRSRHGRTETSSTPASIVVVSVESDDDEDSSDEIEGQSNSGPVIMQLFGLHCKVVSVCLRLAEIHLKNYYSSSAMQALRTAARRLADSLYLTELMTILDDNGNTRKWIGQLRLQNTWLWEHCGHFARSFASDGLWRERGHASGDDVISVLRDVHHALEKQRELNTFSCISNRHDVLTKQSDGFIDINSLDGVVGFRTRGNKKGVERVSFGESAIHEAEKILSSQGLIKREQRRVLVAACIAYGRSIDSYSRTEDSIESGDHSKILGLLLQRMGDACNETGKTMMNEVRNLLSTVPEEAAGPSLAAEPLLCSAEFWFQQGLGAFEACRDLRNLSLLRCNLCQCWKLRANSVFAREGAKPSGGVTHAEHCLQEAANQLQAAHEALGQRDTDPIPWDMVSGELAATFLVLGVRRRQSLIGSGNIPVILHSLRLNPGKEGSIVDPMERALDIYEQSGNHHQAAAAHYQIALFYSKIWTCQRDEVKTREKLAAAFQHFTSASAFFSQNVRGNETTFCVLCLDLANLYSAVSGEEFLAKALTCCLDTAVVFARETIESVARDLSMNRSEWLHKMETLATTVEELVFKILRNLVKIEETKERDYKELYRVGLQAKMAPATQLSIMGDESMDKIMNKLLALHGILEALQLSFVARAIN